MRTLPHILMIDDDLGVLNLAKRALSAEYYLCTASDCLDGVDLLLNERFDLLLINAALPVLDGVELIRIIRTHSPYQQIPIIALAPNPKSVIELGRVKVQAILPKPFSMDDLCGTVANMIGHFKRNATTASAQLSLNA